MHTYYQVLLHLNIMKKLRRLTIFPSIDLGLMCSDDTVICSNTLTLNLDDAFSGIKHPQVVTAKTNLHVSY